jgi:hypothetical protein
MLWARKISTERSFGSALEACNEESEQIGRDAILKASAWLIDQRHGRQMRDPFVWREWAVDLSAECVRKDASDRPAMKLAVGQAGSMRQQIPKRDRALRVVGLIERTLRIAQNTHPRKLRSAARNRLIQFEPPLIEQRQRRDGRHWLRHRRNAKDRIALNRQGGRQVAPADGHGPEDAALSPDKCGSAGQLSCVDVLSDRAGNRVFTRHQRKLPVLRRGPPDIRGPGSLGTGLAEIELDTIALAQVVDALTVDGAGMEEHLFPSGISNKAESFICS